MAKDFRYLTTKPAAGWSAASLVTPQPSSVGPVNALAQNDVSADSLRTTPSTLADTALGSRKFVNPNTGIRDTAVSASVYAQPDTPAFLSQAVSQLNAEQALRRSLQAEWNDKLLQGATGQIAGSDPYVWMEALRAASVNPGASVAFGQAIQDPNVGRAAVTNANSNSLLSSLKANILHQALGTAYDLGKPQVASPILGGLANSAQAQRDANQTIALNNRASFLAPIANSAAGGSPAGTAWNTSKPVSSGWYSSSPALFNAHYF